MRDPFLDWLDTEISNAEANISHSEQKDPTNSNILSELGGVLITLNKVKEAYLTLRNLYPQNPVWPNIRLPDYIGPRWIDSDNPQNFFTHKNNAQFKEE